MRNLLCLSVLAFCCGWPSITNGQWYGSADTIVPTRSVPANVLQRNITSTTAGTPPVTTFAVGSDNLLKAELGFTIGGRATVGYRSEILGIESSILITDWWKSADSVFDPTGRLASPFTPVGAAPNPTFDSNTFASYTYETRLQSAEINLTCLLYGDEASTATCKFGIRGMSVDEEFTYLSQNPTTTNNLSFTTSNRLIGPQLGFQGNTNVWGGVFGLSCLGGLAYNEIDRNELFNGVPTTWNTTEGSLFGELGIEYIFMPLPNLGIRIGYQALGLGNIGLALDDPRLARNQASGVIYSIPYLGVTGTY